MVKIIVRIGLILLAAGLVCGGLILYANNAGAGLGELPGGGGEHLRQGMGQSQERQFKNRPEGALPEGSLTPGGGRGLGHAEYGEPGTDWTGLASQLAKVAVITLVVVGVQWLYRKLRRKRNTNNVVTA